MAAIGYTKESTVSGYIKSCAIESIDLIHQTLNKSG